MTSHRPCAVVGCVCAAEHGSDVCIVHRQAPNLSPIDGYGAQRTTVDNITFASKAEAKRFGELKLLEKAGKIRGLELQPKYPLIMDNKKLATYIADFRYYLVPAPGLPLAWKDLVVEDVKGVRTPLYRLKKKWGEQQYGIRISEVDA